MRIHYKGGVWKNSEDEILKAAVMKYGQNQWARIASLLVRKSAKQCKARWYEWLDPAIKKTQWTREEEEKLLHLVKIMPTQWRTIAPMIGRTAAQCIEHYEKLVDQAQQQSNPDGASASDSDPRATVIAASRQRPGDLDAAPESKPARPDPVDMDEDELEMLSEARARLANTKGKKAKRKAREKQLEAAKRVAQLQKRRELKAAGVPIKPPRKSRKVTDYATETPFERTAAPGFYDTREEDELAASITADKKQIGKLLQKYMGPTEAEKEEEARKKDKAKRKQLEKTNLPAALGLDKVIASASASRSPPLKRARFSLPPPQLSDLELEKMATPGNAPKAVGRESQQTPTNGDKQSHGHSLSPHTPVMNSVASTPYATPGEPWAATRQRHLETIMALKSAETPLRGGENVPLPSLDLDGRVTPTGTDLRTPNPLATPSFFTATSQDASNTVTSRRKRKAIQRQLKETVRRGFVRMPDPENEYELDFGDEQTASTEDDETFVDRELIEDAEEEARRKKEEAEQHIASIKSRILSSAAARNLPIPSEILSKDLDIADVGCLMERDRRVLDILNGSSNSKTGLDERLQVLKKLIGQEISDIGESTHAHGIVDEYVAQDDQAKTLQEEILNALMSGNTEEDPPMQRPSLTPEDSATIDVSLRNDKQFRQEGHKRLEELTKVYEMHGHEQPSQTPTTMNLWIQLGMEIPGDIDRLEDEKRLLKFIEELRSRLSKARLPASLSNAIRKEIKDNKTGRGVK